MKDILAAVFGVAVIIVVLIFGLGWNRIAQPFQEETNRLTETQSRRRVDGLNLDIASMCLNLDTSADEPTKKAFAHRILQQANGFQHITADNRACVSRAQGLIQQ
jgi:hypothetical protein